jgi:uncharacterized protein YfkK (UPF0435 family)
MKQSGNSGSVGFASVVAIIQRLIDSADKKVKEYDSLIKNHTDHCDADKLVLQTKFNESMRMIDHTREKLNFLNVTLFNNTYFYQKAEYSIKKLQAKIVKKNQDYETYNETRSSSLKTLTEAISKTTDIMTSVTFITSINSVQEPESLIGKDDMKKYNQNVEYFLHEIKNLVNIANFYNFKNFTPEMVTAVYVLNETKIENAHEQTQIYLNSKLNSMKDILEILSKTAKNTQAWDLLFQTKISNLNDVLTSRTMMKNNYNERIVKNKRSLEKTEDLLEKLFEYHNSLKKLKADNFNWCKNGHNNFKSLKTSL